MFVELTETQQSILWIIGYLVVSLVIWITGTIVHIKWNGNRVDDEFVALWALCSLIWIPALGFVIVFGGMTLIMMGLFSAIENLGWIFAWPFEKALEIGKNRQERRIIDNYNKKYGLSK